ncbi:MULTISPECIES: polyprenyl synthetase family protein [Ralstonia]|uniref:Farnesyl diphosphate synthase n=1 Tax=Ralstonia wenshanensis TaxID=2842456 RepID=A0AAD2ERD8_9RALS|nr:farnesyl diphosphate synthase [Ralstonia wenshanensis]MCT7305744.1 polyprenyl synthetase family protein [Ralstonia wenshanensis]MDY7508594.1 farnesyl diphosphate synthase [Ralstonia wenshanensis]UGS89916.1 polyprenyl synthetase family protein [Ralstonia wenshanensis]CAJ0696743.1 Farnesyl diphosphate synthase [Ralstonia wenshanensis]
MSDFAQWMASVVARTESALERALPAETVSPQRLHAAMRYATLGAGKRVRPLLAHAAGALGEASSEALDGVSCAVEMIHAYSLVHDDMPCMDDDDLRRGRPTVHRAYDEATALLVGDALQTQAFIVLAELGAVSQATRAVLVAELARASGSLGMAGGQAIDLQSVGIALSQDELEAMHRMKTGALLRASLRMGALCAGVNAAALEQVDAYAGAVGLAFQVVDDILDVTADTATLGKTAGKDEANDKPTYVSILGLDKARALADELHATAGAAVAQLAREIGCEADKARTDRLVEMADLIVRRGH